MTHPIEPELKPVAIKDLRPTQMTIGMREVSRKRESWRQQSNKDGARFLGTHMVPVVLGPGDSHWVVDHHHLARALHEEGVEHVLVSVIAKVQHLPRKRFFTFMDNHNLLHPYDADGKRRDWDELPRHMGKLVDDPFRSLAGEVRRAGGYAKSPVPFTEFLWADFFRDRIRRHHVEAKFTKALDKALELARGHEAAYLPGFAGPDASGDS